jgi:hypothetical protein
MNNKINNLLEILVLVLLSKINHVIPILFHTLFRKMMIARNFLEHKYKHNQQQPNKKINFQLIGQHILILK